MSGNVFKIMAKKLLNSTIIRLALVLILLLILISIISPIFFNLNNLLEILKASSIIGIAAIGVTIAMIAGCIDLSVASIIPFGAVVLGILVKFGYNSFLSIALALLACGLMGFLNGILVVKLGIDALVITLGTMSIIGGLNYILVYAAYGAGQITIISDVVGFIGRGFVVHIPFTVILLIVISLLGYLFLQHTATGSRLFAIGENINTAYLSGILVNRHRILVLIISAIMAGIGGIILTGRGMQVDPSTTAASYTDIIAAVVLGGTAFSGGKGSIQGTIIGIAILGIITNALIILNVNSFWQLVVKGMILLIGLYSQRIKENI
jgi:ribose transport system permease protein